MSISLSAAKVNVLAPASRSVRVAGKTSVVAAPRTAFQVWTPTDNKFFETFSFLPPLSNDEITKQVNYIVGNGWTPCLEFAEPGQAYVSSHNSERFGSVSSGYQDNRYWTMWKLPMFGCQSGDQVLGEMNACIKAFPDAYIRLVAFDAVRQVQTCGFLIHRPPNATEFKAPEKRSVC